MEWAKDCLSGAVIVLRRNGTLYAVKSYGYPLAIAKKNNEVYLASEIGALEKAIGDFDIIFELKPYVIAKVNSNSKIRLIKIPNPPERQIYTHFSHYVNHRAWWFDWSYP